MKMNKKYIAFGIMAMFAITFVVAATYVVNSFTITTDVYEPFEVQYVIMGDGGNYEGGNCPAGDDASWQNGTDVDVGGLYAGESRKVCTKVVNLGEGSIDYSVSSEVLTDSNACREAFNSEPIYTTVNGESTKIVGSVLNIDDGATPKADCEISLSVTRGATAE